MPTTPVKEGFALVKGSAFLVNAGFDKEQKALGKSKMNPFCKRKIQLKTNEKAWILNEKGV